MVDQFCQPTNLAEHYKRQAAANPDKHRYCSENAYVENDADVPAVLDVLERRGFRMRRLPDPDPHGPPSGAFGAVFVRPDAAWG